MAMDDGKQKDLRKGTNLGKLQHQQSETRRPRDWPNVTQLFAISPVSQLQSTKWRSNGKTNRTPSPLQQLIYNYDHQQGRPEVGQQKPFWRTCSISQVRHEIETETETKIEAQRFRMTCPLGIALRKLFKVGKT